MTQFLPFQNSIFLLISTIEIRNCWWPMQMNFVTNIFSGKLYLMENVPFLYLNNTFSEKKQNFFCWRFYQPFGLSLKVWKKSKEGWRQVSRSVLHLSCYRKFSKISRRTPAPKSLFKKRSSCSHKYFQELLKTVFHPFYRRHEGRFGRLETKYLMHI